MTTRIATLMIVLAFTAQPVFSQSSEAQQTEPSTKIGSFMAKKGNVIVKDFYDVGKCKNLEFNALVISESGKEALKVRGLRIEGTDGRNSNTAFLDMDEVESFSKAISYLVQLSTSWKASSKEYTEVTFSTKDNFSFGFYQKGVDQRYYSSVGRIGKVTAFFDAEQVVEIQKIVDKAIMALAGK